MSHPFKPAAVALRDILFLIGDRLFRALRPVSEPAQGDVAVIRLDGIGDFVLWLDSVRHLRNHYAGRRITLICNQAWSDLARCFPFFDEVIPVAARRFRVDLRYRYKTLGILLARNYSVLINPVFTRQGFADTEAIVRVLRAAEKLGSVGERTTGWQERLGGLWYSKLIPAEDRPMTELERNAEFMSGLSRREIPWAHPRIPSEMFPDPARSPEHFYILFPGTAVPIKQWPAESFAELARWIYERMGLTGLVCGAPADSSFAARIIERAGVPLENWAGRTTLPEFVGLMAKAKFVVGNDTGAIHIAAAVSTPSVCVVGGGQFGRFLPYPTGCGGGGHPPAVASHGMTCFGCNWQCVYPIGPAEPAPCVVGVTVDRVARLLEETLASGCRTEGGAGPGPAKAYVGALDAISNSRSDRAREHIPPPR